MKKYILLTVLFFSFNCSADDYNFLTDEEARNDLMFLFMNDKDMKKIIECAPRGVVPFIAHIELFMSDIVTVNDIYMGYLKMNTAIPKTFLAQYHATPTAEIIKYGKEKHHDINDWKYFMIVLPNGNATSVDLPITKDTKTKTKYKCRKPTS